VCSLDGTWIILTSFLFYQVPVFPFIFLFPLELVKSTFPDYCRFSSKKSPPSFSYPQYSPNATTMRKEVSQGWIIVLCDDFIVKNPRLSYANLWENFQFSGSEFSLSFAPSFLRPQQRALLCKLSSSPEDPSPPFLSPLAICFLHPER